jgi:hypothetical protein
VKRREFITLLSGAAAAWPLTAQAKQAGKLPTIGFLSGPTASAAGQWVTAFKERLRELGWIEGRTVAIEVRWAEGHRAFRGDRLRIARRECVDHIIVFSQAQLRRILNNELRTNWSLNKDAPFHRAIQRLGAITSLPVLGGLHHQYCRI